jgi:hypothetical protein
MPAKAQSVGRSAPAVGALWINRCGHGCGGKVWEQARAWHPGLAPRAERRRSCKPYLTAACCGSSCSRRCQCCTCCRPGRSDPQGGQVSAGVPGQPHWRADRRRLAGRDDHGVRAPAALFSPAADRALDAERLPGGILAGCPIGQNVVHCRVSPVCRERSLTWSWSCAAGSTWASRSSAVIVDSSRMSRNTG